MWEFSHVFFNDYDFMKGRKYRVGIVKDPPHHLKQNENRKLDLTHWYYTSLHD